MNLSQVYSSKAVAQVITEAGSNKVAYLGAGLFPAKKKAGLDLKWIKGSKGLPVSLAPSTFDAKATIRTREGFTINETEMAFFRESMLLKEKDRQDILRATDINDPYVTPVIDMVFDDATNLVEGAEVVAERMRMQLLTPADGSPKISIQADGATYAYNYDPTGSYKTNNFEALEGNSKWTDTANSDPLTDVQEAIDAIVSATGSRPAYMLVSPATMGYIKKSEAIKSAILANNTTAHVLVTDAKVKELFLTELQISIVVYGKKYKTEDGVVSQFYADGFATLIPDGALGGTWHGTTPEAADLASGANVDVTVLPSGTTVTVATSVNPVQTQTIVSDIVLPSYERMDETFVIKAY